GRKIGVLVSEGFRVFQTDTTTYLTEMTNLATRSNVIFYSIDPIGLDPLLLTAGDDLEKGTNSLDRLDPNRNDLAESQDSLNAIALDTGGKFFKNNNDIRAGLGSFLQENAAYYLVGFQPEASKWDGKSHKIKVVVKGHPELNVSFRRSYLAKSPAPAPATTTD